MALALFTLVFPFHVRFSLSNAPEKVVALTSMNQINSGKELQVICSSVRAGITS